MGDEGDGKNGVWKIASNPTTALRTHLAAPFSLAGFDAAGPSDITLWHCREDRLGKLILS